MTLNYPTTVGKKTSFRRDCDRAGSRSAMTLYAVGKKTSFRRDCDWNLAHQNLPLTPRRKEDLI